MFSDAATIEVSEALLAMDRERPLPANIREWAEGVQRTLRQFEEDMARLCCVCGEEPGAGAVAVGPHERYCSRCWRGEGRG